MIKIAHHEAIDARPFRDRGGEHAGFLHRAQPEMGLRQRKQRAPIVPGRARSDAA
jgi:hypothetical protein